MPYPKGKPRPRGAGRKKGTPNKATAALKGTILAALDDVGGQKYLVGVARKQPAVFCALLGKILPAEIKATLDTNERRHVTIVRRVVTRRDDGGPAPGPG